MKLLILMWSSGRGLHGFKYWILHKSLISLILLIVTTKDIQRMYS